MRVAVVGLGLIGGSLGAAARRAGHEVTGADTYAGRSEEAKSLGLVDSVAPTIEEAVRGADLVVLAMPLPAILAHLPALDAASPPGAVLMDVASVKRPVIAAMEGLLGVDRCIGGHPLAGKESSGPAAAAEDLFDARPWALCASSRTAARTVRTARSFVADLGARPVAVDAVEHDATLARTSHLPQILATALAAVSEPGDGRLCGPAFWEMTRLAASNPSLWEDILLANRESVGAAIGRIRRELENLTDLLATCDSDGIRETLQRGGAALQRRRDEAVV